MATRSCAGCGAKKAYGSHRLRKNRRRQPGDLDGKLLAAAYPNYAWGLDFQFDEAADRRRLRPLNLVDGHNQSGGTRRDIGISHHHRTIQLCDMPDCLGGANPSPGTSPKHRIRA